MDVAASLTATATAQPANVSRARAQAQEFESVFLAQMLAPMFETVDEDAFGGGAGASTWRSLLVEEYASTIASSGGVGVADAIERELLAIQESAQDGAQ